MDLRLRPFGLQFEKSLNVLIRGLRRCHSPEDQKDYIRFVVSECRDEARSPDPDVKAMAVLKLAYLEMYGYDMSWAGFHILEVMSSSKFNQKRVGYLAAMQSFRSDAEMVMLATNLIKQDLVSASLPCVSLSLSGLAQFMTPLLATETTEDIFKMMSHSRPYVRKKALLASFKIALRHPDVLPELRSRLQLKLKDEDDGVVGAAVNVMAELAQHDLASLLEVAPQLYELLTVCENNWTLIKVLKLFARFVPAEPRLASRVLPSVRKLMNSTQAPSLLYECVSCILRGGMLDASDFALADECVEHLRSLLHENDPNLRYVALEALLLVGRVSCEFIREEQEDVLDCLKLNDLSIRRRSLDLLPLLANEDNLVKIVECLFEQFDNTHSPDYHWSVTTTIVEMSAQRRYALIPNFEWYVKTLARLVRAAPRLKAGEYVGEKLRDIAVRVKAARADTVAVCEDLLFDDALVARQPGIASPAIWIIGEYVRARPGITYGFVESLFQRAQKHDNANASVAIVAASKAFGYWTSQLTAWTKTSKAECMDVINCADRILSQLSLTSNFEVQERAIQFGELFRLARDAAMNAVPDCDVPRFLVEAFTELFAGFDMTPLAPGVQASIQPGDVDLDTPVELPPVDPIDWESSTEEELSEDRNEDSLDISAGSSGAGAAFGDPSVDMYYLNRQTHELKSPVSPSPSLVSLKSFVMVDKKPEVVVPRVKVDIAPDETVEGAGLELQTAEKRPQRHKKPLFHVETSLGSEKSDSAPVTVRRKKIKSKAGKAKQRRASEHSHSENTPAAV